MAHIDLVGKLNVIANLGLNLISLIHGPPHIVAAGER